MVAKTILVSRPDLSPDELTRAARLARLSLDNYKKQFRPQGHVQAVLVLADALGRTGRYEELSEVYKDCIDSLEFPRMLSDFSMLLNLLGNSLFEKATLSAEQNDAMADLENADRMMRSSAALARVVMDYSSLLTRQERQSADHRTLARFRYINSLTDAIRVVWATQGLNAAKEALNELEKASLPVEEVHELGWILGFRCNFCYREGDFVGSLAYAKVALEEAAGGSWFTATHLRVLREKEKASRSRARRPLKEWRARALSAAEKEDWIGAYVFAKVAMVREDERLGEVFATSLRGMKGSR